MYEDEFNKLLFTLTNLKTFCTCRNFITITDHPFRTMTHIKLNIPLWFSTTISIIIINIRFLLITKIFKNG